ncbi:MAG: hypothetical protein QG671_4167, partial [Actinomycetota bacterium]|nr:hypothetical protein [Actinomycetota bacterium]
SSAATSVCDPVESCADLLRAVLRPGADAGPETRRKTGRRQACEIGARAAEAGMDVGELAIVMLAAAGRAWADDVLDPKDPAETVHDRAAQLLATAESWATAMLDGYRHQARTELTRREAERVAFLEDLLTGRADPGGLAERANRYGIRPSTAHNVVLVRGAEPTDALVRTLDAALAGRFGAGNTLTVRRGPDLVCISAGGLRGVPGELAHHLVTTPGAGTWQMAVGRVHRGLRGIATSLEEAADALDLAGRLGFTAPVLRAADLLVFPVLLRDRDAITDLVTTVLGPLREARGGPRPYLETLTALFDNQGNHTATAREMHLSVRAVTYRLERIRALTGFHPAEPTQRFTLQTAVLGARLLGWCDDEGPPTGGSGRTAGA